MNLCILIPLIVGLLSALLGYLLGKASSGGSKDNSADIDFWRNKNSQLEKDLAVCKSKLSAAPASSGVKAASSFAGAAVTAVVFNAGAAKAAFGKAIKQDDLTVVEGIGPKIRDLFHNHGINTWKALSEASVARCQEVLNTGGERYSVHNPGTWPRQAEMAYQGHWEKLKQWQDILDHGKE